MAGSNTVRSPHYGALQDVVDSLYLGLGPKEKLRRLGGRRQAPPAFARGTRGYTVNRPPRPVWPIDTPLRTACSASTICSLS